jgi:23S rRNA (cytosine1962-C5)-methyltransferase
MLPRPTAHHPWVTDDGYALLDAGDGRRLERFGPRTLDRPAPGAGGSRRALPRWPEADLTFQTYRGWTGRADPAAAWEVAIAGLVMECRATASGGVGLYPEHATNLEWLARQVAARTAVLGRPPAILNLFAHTGLVSLAAARAGASVAHVDAARAGVAWARRNADRNDLAGRPIRWLVDDAAGFVEREVRRGRRYDGVVLDPPSFGHAGGRRWELREDLPALLRACATVAADDAFVLLTAHTTGIAGEELGAIVEAAFGRPAEAHVRRLELAAESGARLDLGWAVRLDG